MSSASLIGPRYLVVIAVRDARHEPGGADHF
jgi:hypothetical protein